MRALFLALVLPLLCGCTAVTRQNSDNFLAGDDPGRFEADAGACDAVARDYVSYDLHGMDGTGYDRNRAFNGVYGRCMGERGYLPRPYSRNLLP